MHEPDLEKFDLNTAATRQKRVVEIMQSVLPGIEAQKKKQKFGHGLALGFAFSLFFAGGYVIGECYRPLSYSEKMIVQAMIEHTAQQQKKTVKDIKQHLLATLGHDYVRDIRSHQFNKALMVLGEYVD